MISLRGWHLLVLATSACLVPTASRGADSYADISPAAARRAHALALFYYATNQERILEHPLALVAFEELLALDPTNTAVADRAARIAATSGDRARGRAIIDASLEANPGKVETYLNLSRYLDRFQPEGGELAFAARALQVAGMAEEKFPNDARVCDLLVDLLLQGRDVVSSAKAIGRFAERDGDALYWLTIGIKAERCFETEGGDEAITRAEIDAIYEKALLKANGDASVIGAVANYYIGARNYQRAMAVLESLVKAHPELGLEREKLTRIYRIQGEADKALAELRALVAAYPNEARTQRLLGDLLADEGDYEQAVYHRARAVQLGGAEPEDYVELASQLADHFEPPRYDEAVRWLDRGITTSPVAPRLHYMKGIVLGNMDRHVDALESYRQAEQFAEATLPEMLDSAFYYKLASAADRAGRDADARKHYRRAVELVPVDEPELAAAPLNDHGYMLLVRDEDIDTAGDMIRRAVELDPDNPVHLDSLGWYYFKKALFKKALVELRRAKQLMGDEVDPEVQGHIDAVKAALGESPRES